MEPNRRSPTIPVLRFEPTPCDPARLPDADPNALNEFSDLPDRWRIVSLLGYRENLLDPYHGNNWLKGDRPAFGEDWFFNLGLVSDSVIEPRRFPVPVAVADSGDPGSLDTIGDGEQQVYAENLIAEFVLYQGSTVFKPPDWEIRFTPVFNFNHAEVNEPGILKANPALGSSRTEGVIGVQALFVDKHLRNVSERYDFDSIRLGVQPFTADFRGFLFQDSPFGLRLFGTRDNNRWQYNLAWFRRLEKDTNSGLNNLVELGGDAFRDDDVFVANLYRQDWPALGYNSQLVLAHNMNREGRDQRYDDNGFIQRPSSLGLERARDYDVTYLGYNGDGHVGRWNLSVSAYGAIGEEDLGAFTTQSSDVRAFFGAAEVSRDFDWVRARGTLIYASGDDDPFDDVSQGYDAIFENPLVAGADTSFWIRQPVPLIGGGRVSLSGRNGVLNSLRSSKEFGQSNFTNPGLLLVGAGGDIDLTPTLRASVNANYLWFADTAVLEAARMQAGIGREIGLDLSLALTWRPFASQNIVLRLSAAALVPGRGFVDLYGKETPYSILGNLVFAY
ncbi:MAG TPA: hypothetical protein VFR29_11610 [Steroidobacteraceae bacterium]|nr:hypothetical protein [Steroidobacteraceae bacterium]